MNSTESANGLGNRYLWAWVERSKFLPHGGRAQHEILYPLRQRLEKAVEFGNTVGAIEWDAEARALWEVEYTRLSNPPPGLIGSMTARAAPIVLRLSLIYALLDLSTLVRASHLRAALEVWRYCEESTKFIFGDRLGDPTADSILTDLRAAGSAGLTRTEISSKFHKNKPAFDIDRALTALEDALLADCRHEPTAGRPVER